MLNVSGLQRFYYIRDFHDMRCKYDRIMSVIREQFHREPQKDEVFIVMSVSVQALLDKFVNHGARGL